MYKSVMVIDDNYIDLYIAEISLKKNAFSYEIVTKNSAKSALDYLRLTADKPEDLPQIIFLDINMPEINGFEFLEAFENMPEVVQKNCCIIMLSSSLDPEDIKRGSENKFVSRFLNKPLVREKLKEIMMETDTI